MDGVGNIARHPPVPGCGGGLSSSLSHRPALAGDRVLHIGEAVAMVIAESALAAQDAGEFVDIQYEPLQPVTDARDALKPGAPQALAGRAGAISPSTGRVRPPSPTPTRRRSSAIFAAAKHVARIAEMNQRLIVASMEPRGATVSYDAANDFYPMRTCSQGAGAMRENIMAIMEFAEGAHPRHYRRCRRRLRAENLGLSRIYRALLVAAKKLGRPVHWMSGRSEAFLSDNQARDTYSEAELALDDNGKNF